MGIRTVLSAPKTKESGVHSTAMPDVLSRVAERRHTYKMTTAHRESGPLTPKSNLATQSRN